MTGSSFFTFALVACILCACVSGAMPASIVGKTGPGDVDTSDADTKNFAAVIVNGRTLTGPNTSAQRRDGRLLIPVVSVARALGDTVTVDAAMRTVSVHRQTGSSAALDLRLGQVRENGSLVLSISNAGDLVFSPNPEELLLPAELVSSLLDAAIRFDVDKNAVIVSRGLDQTPTATSTHSRRPFEIYQIDYQYDLNRYSSASVQSLLLNGAGRLGDGRFIFSSSSTGSSFGSASFRTGSFALERPNGQRYIAGDFGTGTDLQFLSTTVRGGSVSIPAGKAVLTAFGGRTYSGILVPFTDPRFNPSSKPLSSINNIRYDTGVFGFFAATNSVNNGRASNPLGFSAGVIRFSGSGRSGDLVSGSVNYGRSRFRLQADLGFGKFTGQRPDNSHFSGFGAAIDLAGTFQATDSLTFQGRYANIGENFLSPQSGLREPVVLKAGGLTWSPGKWFSASLNASAASRPGDSSQNNKYVTVAFALTPPRPNLPRFYLSHSQSSTSQAHSAAFTMLTASKEFSRTRVFLNASRIKMTGSAALNAQLGASFTINDKNSLEVSQGIGSQGAYNGQIDWHASSLLKNRLIFSVGAGYNYTGTSKYSSFERLSASLVLPRQTSLQVNYVQTGGGPTLLVSLRGTLFHKREGRVFLDSPVTEMNSYGKVSGRVYQDVDLNGRFDAGVDLPQAEVKVRVDGNRYVVSDVNGLYSFDSVSTGDHRVYLDLLSVRADLTFLDADAKNATVLAGRGSVFDFRLVRTGRISGRVWLDANENGKFDEGENALADVRVTTASGRDTLTDIDGAFSLGDLPPGDHVILLDEKTLPEKTMAELKPQTARAFPGRETGEVMLPVMMIPAEVKRFGSK
jgi:hypothetical protein